MSKDDCTRWTRRRFAAALGGGLLGGLLPLPARAAFRPGRSDGRRVVIVGGGFGGTIAARTIRLADPGIEVVLVSAADHFVACAGSNLVIAGLRAIEQNRIDYRRLAADYGIHVVVGTASAVDAAGRTLTVGAQTIAWDRLVLSPGIELRFAEIAGYDPETTPQRMPHAWQAGAQTLLLREQLLAMRDGGTFVITVPKGPIRSPAGPYERACLAARHFQQAKPKSRVLIIDENPRPPLKEGLFQALWEGPYKGIVEYRGGQVIHGVAPEALAVRTADGVVGGDVVNVIPPQAAAAIARQAGVVDEAGEGGGRWCPVDPATFESRQVRGIHVIGDACIGEPMPKTGFSANSQAKVCALNLVATLNGKRLIEPSSANVTYSFVSERTAISMAAVYRVERGRTVEVAGAGGASAEPTEIEYLMGIGWLDNILAEMAG
jgi:sulfide dehydrogenase [flavocytochrome c] flavoprotein subunit